MIEFDPEIVEVPQDYRVRKEYLVKVNYRNVYLDRKSGPWMSLTYEFFSDKYFAEDLYRRWMCVMHAVNALNHQKCQRARSNSSKKNADPVSIVSHVTPPISNTSVFEKHYTLQVREP